MLSLLCIFGAVAQLDSGGGGGEAACPNGSCSAAKKSCAAAFGEAYTLLASPEPYLLLGGSSNGKRQLVINVEYTSLCNAGGSMFTAKVKKGTPGTNALFDNEQVILVHRDVPECDGAELDEPEVARDTIFLNMPESTVGQEKDFYIAFPPNGAFDMFLLEEKADEGFDPEFDGDEDMEELYRKIRAEEAAEMAKMDAPATSEEEAAKIANALEDQTELDSVNFLQHCEDELAKGQQSECCSPRMMAALRNKTEVESKLGSAKISAASAAEGPVKSLLRLCPSS